MPAHWCRWCYAAWCDCRLDPCSTRGSGHESERSPLCPSCGSANWRWQYVLEPSALWGLERKDAGHAEVSDDVREIKSLEMNCVILVSIHDAITEKTRRPYPAADSWAEMVLNGWWQRKPQTRLWSSVWANLPSTDVKKRAEKKKIKFYSYIYYIILF